MIAASFIGTLVRWMPVASLLCCGTSLFGQSPYAPPVSAAGLTEWSVPGETIASWPADPWMTAEQERRIFAAFRQPWNGPGFVKTPLTDAMREFERSSGIAFDVDGRALAEVGLTPEAPVTADLQQISRGMALRKTLRDLDLTFRFAGGAVTITTPEAAEARLAIRVYDVTPLVAGPGAISGGRYRGGDSLVELIYTTVVPETWEGLGGPSTIVSRRFGSRAVLVIPTTSEVHFKIITLLNRLNQVGYSAASLGDRPGLVSGSRGDERQRQREQRSPSDSGLPRFGN